MLDSNKRLAALAVFRELYDKDDNINQILSEFIIAIIKKHTLHNFSKENICEKFREDYHFDIPPAVIQTSLKKINFITVSHREYTVNGFDFSSNIEIENIDKTIEQENESLLQSLFLFVEKSRSCMLEKTDKVKIVENFKDYLLDTPIDPSILDEISAFIIVNNNNESFNKTLQRIKEGVILFTGLKYNPSFNHNNWNDKLVIYLNTEILFHFGKFNDDIFYELFNDFYNLVKEANSKKKIIYLKYTQITKEEIERFFYTAELIVKNKMSLNPTSEAMSKLVTGCSLASVIVQKKIEFFRFLEAHSITESDEEINLGEENYKYNIDSSSLLDDLTIQGNDYNIEPHIDLLNFISIKRAHRVKNNFSSIGYILLTENRKIQQIAWNENVKEDGNVPLATNLQFMTNKLWYKLHKGFGSKTYPSSFKVITKAQIILSSHVSEKLSSQYHELQEKVHDGTLTEENALSILYEFKKKMTTPTELSEENVSTVLHMLQEEGLDDYIETHEKIKMEAEATSKENLSLKTQIDEFSKENENVKLTMQSTLQENDALQKDLTIQEKELKENILSEKRMRLKDLKKTKDRVGNKSKKKYDRFKLTLFLPLPSLYLIVFISMYFFGWNIAEPIAWIVTISIPFLVNGLYLYVEEKTLNIPMILEIKKKNILAQESKSEEFIFEDIETLSNEIDVLLNGLKG